MRSATKAQLAYRAKRFASTQTRAKLGLLSSDELAALERVRDQLETAREVLDAPAAQVFATVLVLKTLEAFGRSIRAEVTRG
jgi:hypothetical protein